MTRNSVTLESTGLPDVGTSYALATAGTIDTSSDLVRVLPAAAVTGVILSPGKFSGQQVTVMNEAAAANTLTFATAATSLVADGATSVIPGLRASEFCWNPAVGRWFRTA